MRIFQFNVSELGQSGEGCSWGNLCIREPGRCLSQPYQFEKSIHSSLKEYGDISLLLC